ncbi:MAG TPA: AbrB/MazE/SpoVT family DNA-binding domain-containing protein [Sphingomonas sp.]|nr:AbrB/MazE/SpoVT family DNA-binding domain-containing protein [Sphingomonas sp.]
MMMTHVIVGKWGKNLAIRVPFEIARASGLSAGEDVEIEALDGDILIRRSAARDRSLEQAQAAAAEIIADSKGRSLGDISIHTLREEGRRG